MKNQFQIQRLGYLLEMYDSEPYYERDLIIIKRVGVYKYTNTIAKGENLDNKMNLKYTLIQ